MAAADGSRSDGLEGVAGDQASQHVPHVGADVRRELVKLGNGHPTGNRSQSAQPAAEVGPYAPASAIARHARRDGEMPLMNQYLFRPRARAVTGSTATCGCPGTEEIGHIELLASATAMNLDGMSSEKIDDVVTN